MKILKILRLVLLAGGVICLASGRSQGTDTGATNIPQNL